MTNTTLEPTTQRHRCGDTRDDGKVFWRYSKECLNGEWWVTREHYEQLRIKHRETQKRRLQNPEKKARISSIQKEVRKRRLQKNPSYEKDRYQKNRERFLKKKKEKYWQNREAMLLKQKNWRLANPEKVRERDKARIEKIKEWSNKKYQSDTLFRFRRLIRSATSRIFKVLTQKSNGSAQLLGTTIEKFKEHLENSFSPGMTWENQGKNGWHIDHIIPLSCAVSERHVEALCHYTNLQPLWKVDNLRKHAKLPDEVPENIKHLLPQNWNE